MMRMRTRSGRTAAAAAVLPGVPAAALLVLVVLGALLAAVVAAPAADATTYRYWTYWWGQPSGGWSFASAGPGADRPKDQSVLGWRFAVTTEAGGRKQPRTSGSWSAHCTDAAADGMVRVAVVVDYGTTGDAPPGERPPGGGTVRVECVTVPAGSNGYAVLKAAGVSVRARGDGLVCGIDGYPRTECAAAVADPKPAPTRTSASPKPTRTTGAGSAATTTPTPDRSSQAARPSSPAASAASPTTASASASGAASQPVTGGSPTSAAAPSSAGSDDEAPLPVSSGAPVGAAPQDPGSPMGFGIGAVLLVLAGGAAWWSSRRRAS
ncbi:MAG: hypothetical protein LCI03_00435 [Actinobacteria bacterium]|nr:hypothetical protein [Actinomycetota bacterium]